MMGHHHRRRWRGGFVEHTIDSFYGALQQAISADNAARQPGVLQRLDPRVKVGGVIALIVAAAMATKLSIVGIILLVGIVLALVSLISLRSLATRVWLVSLIFSVVLALPALFVVPGALLYQLPILHWAVTAQGATSFLFLVLRAETTATLAMVLVLTTPWAHVLKALRMFRVPVVFVAILGMTGRYILLLLQTAHEMFESRKCRTVGALTRSEHRRMAIQFCGALLNRSMQLSAEVFLAMQARGFRGEIYLVDDFQMRPADWLAAFSFAVMGVAFVWMGR